MCVIGGISTSVTPVTESGVKMPRYTDRSWWTVEDAANLLRVNIHTLYRAVAANDFPHSRVGPYIRIPCEALLLTPHPSTRSRNYHLEDDGQLAFEFDVPLVPVRLYRNSSEPVRSRDKFVH